MKKRITALLLCLVMVFSLIPTTVWAASNSTVVLHPSVNNTVTGVKVKVNDMIDGYSITKISGYDITVDLGKYNVNNGTFRLPYAKDIWEGVDNNKVDYISWAGSGSNQRSEGGSALLANGKNTAYYYFKGAPVLLTFTLNYDANGGNGAPASQTYKATSQYEKSYTFTISSQTPTREGYNFLGWNTDKNAATASKQPGNTIVVNNNNNPTTLYAVWEEKAPVTPDDPKVGENFDFSKDIVKVICETTDTHNDSYGLKNGYYSVSDKKQLANGNWQCKITIDLDSYFALYNSEHTGHTRDMNHPKATSIMTIYPTWYASTRKWSSAESLIDAAEIYVKCEATQPEGPGENDTPNMAELLTVECVTADAKHTPKSAQYDIVDKGTLTQATDTTWTYTVTLNRTTYIDKFNGETKTAHTDKAPNDVITLTWNWENGKWTKGFDENPVIKCECKTEIEPPTDGPTDDDVKAALGNVTVTVKCINPGTKHTSCAYGVLGGNDGYQLTKNKNTAYIWGYATTYYDVIFDSNGGTAVDTQKNVQYGTTATKPENPTREGYRFLGWFTKDGEAFDFSTPITKSMTLTAKWEIVNINAYIIPITSDGTQLVGAGFDMALNTTTLSRVGLPGYEDEDAVRIHFATFASSAGLADAEDYFPGTDPLVVKAVADLKNGLERRFAAGVNEAKADGIMSKTNWTYLHVGELDNEEDTNFLSGNLVFYSARFVTEDSEHVTGMPNAEYTHNAVAVYDYYLDGETITIPDAVPERYGYDFLGWSVKAVPAENDKLLKAGDTVTVDGDVVFTAQWKLKEYTVSFDSKGGTKVDSQIVEHGSTATKPGNPHRNDYTFKGWYLDGKKFDFSTPITGDITLVARWATKTSGGSNGSSDTTTKDNGKTVQSGKTFDGGIALYVGLSVLSATGSALVITKKKRG